MKSFFSKNRKLRLVPSAYYLVAVLIPILLVFRNLFWGNLPTWGDAPFFFPEGLRELFSEPLTWTNRNVSFGGINSVLWISPIMFLMGGLNKFLSLGNNAVVTMLFYFPSIILSGSGAYLLAKYLKLSGPAVFVASLFYVLNSYFILLVDGGQIGVSLAYGFFPFVILFGKKLFDETGLNNFFIFLISVLVLTTVDPRVSLVALITLAFWQALHDWKKLWLLLLAGMLLIPLNFYWIYPLIGLGAGASGAAVADLQLSSLLNSLLLYSPHWPNNVFGKVMAPPFYFVFVPFLIFGGLIFVPRSGIRLRLTLLFLIFAFITKGTTPPLGNLYDCLINLPFGFAFRDSSKFFVPLTLFGGILMGETVNRLQSKSKVFPVLIYFYLLLLITPALFGKLNFNLSNRKVGGDFQMIYEKLKKEPRFFRTLWFPEKHPLAFEISTKPAVSARDLVQLKPFAFINASNDVFNLLNNPKYIDWLKVLGVRYLFLPGDVRNINPTKDESRDWQNILTLVDITPELKKLDWGLNFPVYEIDNVYPEAYSVKSLVGVVGPPLSVDIYPQIPALYFEDGKLDPALLSGKGDESLKIFFNGKNNDDLIMSFLQKYFVSTSDNVSSQWAVYNANEYLNVKYELLFRGYKYNDFDYGKGVAFSTNKGEAIRFKLRVPENGRYVLATRHGTYEEPSLHWSIEERNLTKGSFEYIHENESGFEVLNTVALIPVKDFEATKNQADILIKHFGVVSESDGLKKEDWKEVALVPEGTLKYKLESPQMGYWVILSQNYHSLWNFKKGVEYFESVPVYSMVNGFYVDPKWGDLHIEFRGQEAFRWGLWISAVTFLSLVIVFLYLKTDKK